LLNEFETRLPEEKFMKKKPEAIQAFSFNDL